MAVDKVQKIEKKKEIIIEALTRCLDRSVYTHVSLEDVAKEAGFSKGGLRHYYPTKEELIIEFIDRFFERIHRDHLEVIQGLDLDYTDQAVVTTLYGLEKFLLDRSNTRILINILLYGFEDEKIMAVLTKSIRSHLMTYENVIAKIGEGKKSVDDVRFIARITQIILLMAGLFESIDPVSMDTTRIVEFLMKIYRDCN